MKSLTRSKSTNIGLAALLAVGMMFSLAQNAKAAGTASNTTISNSATLAYSVSGVSQTDITSTAATFVVDNKVNLTVAKVADAPTIAPGSTKRALAYTVTNNGNTSQRYALSYTAGAATISSMSNVAIYRDVNGDNLWDTNDTLYVDAGTFGNVLADGSLKILIVADTPAGATNTQTAVFNLVATTVDADTTTVTTTTAGADTAGVDVVLADIAGSAAGDGARDGKHSVSATYTVSASSLSVSKSVVLVCDPYNGVTVNNPKNIPGSITKWTILVSNGAGAADATLTTISDALASSLTHDSHLSVPTNAATCVSAAGTAESLSGKGFKVTTSGARNIGGVATQTIGFFTSANDADGVELNAGTITATFSAILPLDGSHASAGLLKASETVSIIFNTTTQ